MGETEKRDEMVKGLHEEAQLQIVLLQHQATPDVPPRGGKTPDCPALSLTFSQVQKAQIEKAEIKADMTKERLELSQVSNPPTQPPFNYLIL